MTIRYDLVQKSKNRDFHTCLQRCSRPNISKKRQPSFSVVLTTSIDPLAFALQSVDLRSIPFVEIIQDLTSIRRSSARQSPVGVMQGAKHKIEFAEP